MSQRLVITTHRPKAGQELLRSFVEWHGVWGIHAFSTVSAWPEAATGGLNHAVLDLQAAGLTCCVLNQLRVEDLVEMLRTIQPGAILHAPLLGLPASGSPVEEYQSIVNGTLTWLEAARQACPTVPFIHLSSSQVYGDRANTIQMEERPSRWEFTDPSYIAGLTEHFPIEASTHTLLGAAAVAADVLAQEYHRSFFLPVVCLRIDSLCDPGNGLEDRRDFLSQLAHCCLTETEYLVQGEAGRQVREIVSTWDLALLVEAILRDPRPGGIYNVGAGQPGSCSIAEAMEWIEKVTGKSLRRKQGEFLPLGEPRIYYSNNHLLRHDYPKWEFTETWKELARRVVETQSARIAG